MATPRHTPRGRGYDTFLGYFHHANDYNTCGIPITAVGEVDVCKNKYLDLWLNDGPATKLAGTKYEEELFADHSLQAIHEHDPSKQPLFLFHSFHLVHTPLQVPQATLDLFKFIDYPHRRLYASMVYYMDTVVGRLVQALKDKQMYDNSIILFFSDNGGPIYNPGSASNYPLRAGKYADFEGGVRVNALASGGRIPSNRRGTHSTDFIHVADIYATFVRLANYGTTDDVSPSDLQIKIKDMEAEKVGLPPVDSIDAWPAIISSNGPKRTEIHLSTQALIQGKFKLVVGVQPMNIWQGPQYPNATGSQPAFLNLNLHDHEYDCGPAGCLFDIFSDPTEHQDIASQMPQLRLQMLTRLQELNKSEFTPNRGKPDALACHVAKDKWNGFYGPFLQLHVSVGSSLLRGSDDVTVVVE